MNDLREMFPGIRWRWTDDHPKGGRFDPFHVELVGKYGEVFLHSLCGTILQAHLTSKIIGKRIASIENVRIHQLGDNEMSVTFLVADADAAMGLIRMKKKRVGGGNADALEKARKARKSA